MTKKKKTDEFAGFLANPNDRRRGGKSTRAVRGRCRRGFLEHLSCTLYLSDPGQVRPSTGRLAQMEANRRWRAEIARRETSR